MSEPIRTGGCQCGAVRFRVSGKLGRPSICHCRMCQKQFGGFFSALVTAPDESMEWTRGEPSYFQSSINIERGFCKDCGTPMTYRHPGGWSWQSVRSTIEPTWRRRSRSTTTHAFPGSRRSSTNLSTKTRIITRSRRRSSPSSTPITIPQSGQPKASKYDRSAPYPLS
ncbi:hypothetical protein RGCCGE502_06719 [Rhizobium grahamii CCGE 502]|uniref:CENP-V/GFA domain-containing protein n=1 Tax=Rhizobium grahamii CCGE 502 TaxID=990285 RepID=S3HKE2_9HYPH|nr:hypothetical protein RGCCGE502_06719 [Rhizobium grahamii CCGE 502]